MTAYLLHLRRSPSLIGIPLGVALGLWLAYQRLWPGVATWEAAAEGIVGSSVLLGPLFAGLAAWSGVHASRRGLTRLWMVSPRPHRAVLALVAANATWAAACYAVIAIVVSVPTGIDARWGAPLVLWMVVGLLGVLSLVGFGTWVGVVLPFRLTAPLAATGAYLLIVALVVLSAGISPRLQWLSPGIQQVQDVFFATNDALLAAQGVWFLGLLGLSLGMLFLATGGGRRVVHATVAGASTLALVGAVAIVTMPSGFFLDRPYSERFTYSCDADTPQLCLHPAFAGGRSELEPLLKGIAARIEGTPLEIRRIVQTNRGVGGFPPIGSTAVHFDDFRDDWAEETVAEMVAEMFTPAFPTGPCSTVAQSNLASPYVGFTSVIVRWVSGTDSAVVLTTDEEHRAHDRFDAMDDAGKRQWITDNLDQLCSGTIDGSQVP